MPAPKTFALVGVEAKIGKTTLFISIIRIHRIPLAKSFSRIFRQVFYYAFFSRCSRLSARQAAAREKYVVGNICWSCVRAIAQTRTSTFDKALWQDHVSPI